MNFCIFFSLLADIPECAVVILNEPIAKYDRTVYKMGDESLSNEQRAANFSKVLGKPITYEQQSTEDFYKAYIGFDMYIIRSSIIYYCSSWMTYAKLLLHN